MLRNALTVLFALEKLPEAEELLGRVRANSPPNSRIRMETLRLQYHRGQFEEFKQGLDAARRSEDPDLRARASEAAHFLARREGRFGEAAQLWSEARASEVARGFVLTPLEDSLQAAEFDLLLRQLPNRASARLDAALAAYPLGRSHPVDRPYARLAKLYALAGRPDMGRVLLKQFADLNDTALTRIRKPSTHLARAEIALAERRPQDAIREFRAGYRLKDGPVGDPLAEAADLARAFDQAGEADSAIAHYQEFLRRPSWNRLAADGAHLPTAHQRLAELYTEQHDKAAAEHHYRELAALFRHADAPQRARVALVRERLAKVPPGSVRLGAGESPRRAPRP
jgi:tetratricopeptide (TPR) repeat protein